jgi:hypothetical protein
MKSFINIDPIVANEGWTEAPWCWFEHGTVYLAASKLGGLLSMMVRLLLSLHWLQPCARANLKLYSGILYRSKNKIKRDASVTRKPYIFTIALVNRCKPIGESGLGIDGYQSVSND